MSCAIAPCKIRNGAEREVRGKVQRAGSNLRAEIVSPDGPEEILLPSPTLMPVASIDHIIERLRGGAATFPTVSFDAQVIGDAFRVEVRRIDAGTLRRRPPADKPVLIPGKSWPVVMSFSRGDDPRHKPLFTFGARLFESGVLDRVTVDAGPITVTADLRALQMRPSPSCPQSPGPARD